MVWQILVVDDEPINLEIVAEYLDSDEFALTFAADGEAAWQALESAPVPIDLILLDRMMPLLDGIGFLRRIKSKERYREVPVIMQTAADTPTQIREGLDAGAYYYLTKPYDASMLLGIVRAALSEVADWRAAAEKAKTSDFELALGDAIEFDFRTLGEAHELAGRLAKLCADPAIAAMGLTELLVNAVEHGNLAITYAEKKALRLSDNWEIEVERRLESDRYAHRVASIRIERLADEIRFTVIDEGDGFDWRRYLGFDPERAFDPNGRGIAIARQAAFRQVEYHGTGNTVVAVAAAAGASA